MREVAHISCAFLIIYESIVALVGVIEHDGLAVPVTSSRINRGGWLVIHLGDVLTSLFPL